MPIGCFGAVISLLLSELSGLPGGAAWRGVVWSVAAKATISSGNSCGASGAVLRVATSPFSTSPLSRIGLGGRWREVAWWLDGARPAGPAARPVLEGFSAVVVVTVVAGIVATVGILGSAVTVIVEIEGNAGTVVGVSVATAVGVSAAVVSVAAAVGIAIAAVTATGAVAVGGAMAAVGSASGRRSAGATRPPRRGRNADMSRLPSFTLGSGLGVGSGSGSAYTFLSCSWWRRQLVPSGLSQT